MGSIHRTFILSVAKDTPRKKGKRGVFTKCEGGIREPPEVLLSKSKGLAVQASSEVKEGKLSEEGGDQSNVK